MGQYCRICDRRRPSEAFSRRGGRIHVCKRCAQKPKKEREPREQTQEIAGYLRQLNISEKNRTRLQQLAASPYPEIARLASATLAVAGISRKRSLRWRRLAEQAPAEFTRLDAMGLVPDYCYDQFIRDDFQMPRPDENEGVGWDERPQEEWDTPVPEAEELPEDLEAGASHDDAPAPETPEDCQEAPAPEPQLTSEDLEVWMNGTDVHENFQPDTDDADLPF